MKKLLAMLLVLCMMLSALPAAAAAPADAGTDSFAEEFKNPTDIDYKPYVRWWFAPGNMEEEETRREVRTFSEMGYGGVEVIALDNARGDDHFVSAEMNGPEWNECMKWILDEAYKCGIKVDVTLGELWPIASNMILPEDRYDDVRAEQELVMGAADFTAAEGTMTYTGAGWVFPEELVQDEKWSLVAVTVAKKNADGTYNADTSADITDLVNAETGAVTWTAPDEGDWTVFYGYQQGTGYVLGYGIDMVVVDHLSKDATQLVIQDFQDAIDSDPELKELYQKAGGCFFGDSFELSSSTRWTGMFLEEFEARRGYDLTPYLPAIYSPTNYNDASADRMYEFDQIADQVRMDYGQTVSELIAENHLAVFDEWAEEELGMDLRYQVHSSSGALLLDETVGALEVDIPETESFALRDSMDSYRSKSAAVHMMNSLYGSETAAQANLDYRQTWTGSVSRSGKDTLDLGFMHYTNRLFASGVNKLTFHGASYHAEVPIPPFFGNEYVYPSFPGLAIMSNPMNHPNEWDDKTPLYEHAQEMLSYLTRTQMVLQQGQADMDLAVYRLFTTPSDKQAAPYDINLAGYNFDYVTANILKMDNAVVGEQDGRMVLAPDGPSYKALVIDQRTVSGEKEAFAMTVETAKTILGYAKAGLPVVIVGEAPSMPATLTDDAAELQAVMTELKALAAQVASAEEVEAALRGVGVTPDADPETPASTVFFHRTTEDAEFYFVANDSADTAVTQTLTLKGQGQPYLLNAWTGEIEPIADYTVGEGTVTVEISLIPQEQMLIAVAPNGWFETTETFRHAVASDTDELYYEGAELLAKTTKAGTYTVELDNGRAVSFDADAAETVEIKQWEMVIHQWLPLNPEDPTYKPYEKQIVDTKVYTLNNADGMLPWYEIDENLLHTMGVGEYSTTVTLEKGWEDGQGAVLHFTDVTDTMELIVNGAVVPVNQIKKDTDIGPWLRAGENTIVIKTATTAGNYVYAKDMFNFILGATPAADSTFQFGVLGEVTLTPYVVTSVYKPTVTLNVSGEAEVTLDVEELTYTVSAADAENLATATLTFEVNGLEAPVVAGINGWSVITQTVEGGVVTAVLYNLEGVTGSADIAALTGKTTGKIGDVTVALTEAVLSAYVGDSEAFIDAIVTNGEVTTTVKYSVYDVNQDGTVNQLDITRAQRFYGAFDELADVNDDKEVNIDDLILILQNYSV